MWQQEFIWFFHGVRASSKETVAPPRPTYDSRLTGVDSITNGVSSRQNRFFHGVRTSSKETVAPPKKAMIADSLELLPSQMTRSPDRTVLEIGTDQNHVH